MGRQQGVWTLIAFLLLAPLAASSGAGAQTPPEEGGCIAYAFTRSQNHAFLLESNSTVYGGDAIVIHDCGNVTVAIDGAFAARGESGMNVPLPSGQFNMVITDDDQSILVEAIGVEMRPDRLEWEYEWEAIQSRQPVSVEPDFLSQQQNIAAGITALIVWVLSVQVFWHLVNGFVQRNFIEEVA